jgi:hypothetical protein
MFEILSISISFVGSILLAFSISKNPSKAYQEMNGKKKFLTIINPGVFRCGVVLLATGFALQIIQKLCNLK